MDRKLAIDFHPDGDVEYYFHCNQPPLYSYRIAGPAESVALLETMDSGHEIHTHQDGCLELRWCRPPASGWRTVHYIKRGKLQPMQLEGKPVFHYEEDIEITAEPYFALWLRAHSGPLRPVEAVSSSEFRGVDGCVVQHKPCELEERVFQVSGVLSVDWTLEPTKRSK